MKKGIGHGGHADGGSGERDGEAGQVIIDGLFQRERASRLGQFADGASGHLLRIGIFENRGLGIPHVVTLGLEARNIGIRLFLLPVAEESTVALPSYPSIDEIEVASFHSVRAAFFKFLNSDFLCFPHGARKGENEREINLFRATDGQRAMFFYYLQWFVTVLKTDVVKATVGSNPTPSAIFSLFYKRLSAIGNDGAFFWFGTKRHKNTLK